VGWTRTGRTARPGFARRRARSGPGAGSRFGYGIHLCLGAELSRTEISTALTALLDRLPTLRLAPGTRYEGVESPMFCGPQRVEVVW
jgi:cytochrome P450